MTAFRTRVAAGPLALAALALSAALALPAGSARAAPQVERVRGTIDSVGPDTVTVRTVDGKTETVRFAPTTRFAHVIRASLDAVKEGSFIGTAAKPGTPPTALEVVIFPEALRGAGEGHYAWDMLPDTVSGGGAVETSMTNGTVQAPRVETSMTNGTVAASAAANGERTLTVAYKGQSIVIAVPAKAPVVTLEPADAAILVPGAKVFAVAARDGDRLDARSVSVGKDGLTPPM
ncbi:hypothetical protein OPKNFCMD_2131 [Methylobacterium crusticola]|uniref:Metal ABC transporter permease n=1 Tax=Methylobacterium crusticola TaxID=1697972 RepID=A0ABQ4QXN7_9HYPH|nr:metal ABC transporter permease [Methylobacterium crusticola]GJD49401.1 hypothetical protein OPKNFCMD_2131 [Methylobacterium crusticola]